MVSSINKSGYGKKPRKTLYQKDHQNLIRFCHQNSLHPPPSPFSLTFKKTPGKNLLDFAQKRVGEGMGSCPKVLIFFHHLMFPKMVYLYACFQSWFSSVLCFWIFLQQSLAVQIGVLSSSSSPAQLFLLCRLRFPRLENLMSHFSH